MKLLQLAAVIAALTGGAVAQERETALRELAPTGKLRVAIAISSAPSALYAVKGEGGYRGVTVDLGRALADKLGVAVEYVAYQASGEITDAAAAPGTSPTCRMTRSAPRRSISAPPSTCCRAPIW